MHIAAVYKNRTTGANRKKGVGGIGRETSISDVLRPEVSAAISLFDALYTTSIEQVAKGHRISEKSPQKKGLPAGKPFHL